MLLLAQSHSRTLKVRKFLLSQRVRLNVFNPRFMKSSHRMEVILAIVSNKIATNYDKLQIKGKGQHYTVGRCNVKVM